MKTTPLIEELDINDARYKTTLEKINELIRTFNYHYHEHGETSSQTSFPAVLDVNDQFE